MTSPLRLAVLPVLTLCFAACLTVGACTAFEPLANQSSTPDWVRERLVNDVEGRKAPRTVPAYGPTALEMAQFDSDARAVMLLRALQNAEIAVIESEGGRDVDDFVADGRARTTPPE